MIEFLDAQSAFEHYKRVLGRNDPIETRAKYIATVFMWSITTLILASLLLARFSQKAPAAIRVLLLACYRGRRQRPDNWRQRQKGCVEHQVKVVLDIFT
jgi:hypothetical protein